MRLVSLQTPCPVWALCLKNNGKKSKERYEREMVPWRTEKGKDIHLEKKGKAGEILDAGFMFLKGRYWLEGASLSIFSEEGANRRESGELGRRTCCMQKTQ